MPISPDALKDTCRVRPRSEGAFGPEYGTGVVKPCYVEPGATKTTNREGEEVIADAVIFLQSDASASPGDLVEFGSKRYEVVRVDAFRPKGQPHHLEVAVREIA